MLARAIKSGMIDRLGIALSGLCAVHCVASLLFVAMLASAGAALLDPIIHEVGLALAMILGVVALGRGAMEHRSLVPAIVGSIGLLGMAAGLMLPHGSTATFFAIGGVSLLALGHLLNRRAAA